MSRNQSFRYALQPVLATRQWALDALMQDLERANAAVVTAEEQLAGLDKLIGEAGAAQQKSMASPHFRVDHLRLFTQYLKDLGERRAAQQSVLSEIEQQRDALIERVVHARRRVDAVEKHRDKARQTFMRGHASAQCKAADDQWLTLQAHRERYDNHS